MMDWTNLGVLIGAMVLAAGCANAGRSAAAGPGRSEPEPEKQVLALQAFFDRESLQVIEPAWELAIETEGMQCAGAYGMRPHMTFGSWRVTAEELEEALQRGRQLDGKVPGRRVRLEPRKEEDDESGAQWFFYEPPDDPELHRYHRAVHERLAFSFEPFRPIDLPGQWEPHVTMFSSDATARQQMERAVQTAEGLKEVEIVSYGLVTFGPIRTAFEIRCAPPATGQP